jgi:hypothetical protein
MNGQPLFTFSWTVMRRRLHSHFKTCLGDSVQFAEVSNSERPSGLGHWPLAYQFEAR